MPLGWHVSVYRPHADGARPAAFGDEPGARLAVWHTGLGGLDWLTELVRERRAVALGGDGYPVEFAARAGDVIPVILAGPPLARVGVVAGVGEILAPDGRTASAPDVIAACRPDEWLLVQAWDES